MKRRNHVVLGSITVLASVGLAGLFIFPASGEGEQHYNCIPNAEGDEYNCTLVEDASANYTHTCADAGGDRIRCTGESGQEQLNFCEGRDSLVCYQGYTKGEINLNGGYYFTKDFGGKFHCNDQRLASLDSNDLITVNDLGTYGCTSIESSEQYSQCDKDEDSFFCLANYDCDNEGGGYICHEDNNRGEYNCELKSSGPRELSLTPTNYEEEYICSYNGHGEGEYQEIENCYIDSDYPEGYLYCPKKYVPEQDGSVENFYENPTAESDYYYCEVTVGPESVYLPFDSKCYLPSQNLEAGVDCFYEEGEFICPLEYSCTERLGGEYCYVYDSEEDGEGGYYCADNGYFFQEDESVSDNNNLCISKDGREEFHNCEYNDGEYFCPADTGSIKYDCDSEDGLSVVCNPVTTGNFSCKLPSQPNKASINSIQDGNYVCSDGSLVYDTCYSEGEKYICPIPQKCELEAGGYYCTNNWEVTDYYYCKFKSLVLDQAFGSRSRSDSFCERQTGDGKTLPDCYYEDYGEVYCPSKYSCTLSGGVYECTIPTGGVSGDGYFHCRYKYHNGVAKAVTFGMEGDYRCVQPEGTKTYEDCDYDATSDKFICMPKYFECNPESGGYQCNPKDGGEYQCGLPGSDIFLRNAEGLNYQCYGNGNLYSNCTSNESGYFCPIVTEYQVEFNPNGGTLKNSSDSPRTVVSGQSVGDLPEVTRDGYRFDGWFTAAAGGDKYTSQTSITQNVTLYAHWTKYNTVTFNANGGSSVSAVSVVSGESVGNLPSSSKNGYTLDGWFTELSGGLQFTSSTVVTGDIKLYAHWTENKPSGGYSGGGGSSRGTSKGSGPSSSDVKSVDNAPDTQTKNEPKPEVKPVVKPVNNGGTKASSGKVSPAQELADAYKWAYANGLTKYANMSDARLDDYLNRQEMAKISTIFATKFHGETPNEAKRKDCSQYPDLRKTTSDMQEFIKQSCELGYMGYRANGVDYLERFRPYTPVSVAEVSIILSRIMWKNKYAISENKWYQGHLHAVYENQLLDDITKPFDYITRRDAYIMLYRLSDKL